MKQLLTIFAIMLVGLTLTACGQQQDDSASGQADAQPADGGAQEHPGNEPAAATAQEHPGDEPAGAAASSGLGENPAPDAEPAAEGSSAAVAELAPTEGNTVSGTINFVQGTDGVNVTAQIEGLTPGKHGFHIHENGDCSAPDGKSAGGHFNPAGAEHGAPTDPEHHEGDMGNITASDGGTATVNKTFDFLKMGEGEDSIIGKAVVVHGGEDDLTSQPSGDAGARVACAVIKPQSATGINSHQ